MQPPVSVEQEKVCKRFEVEPVPSPAEAKIGVASNVRSGLQPINGFRHQPEVGTTGWFVYAGEELSTDPDYFSPLHISHVQDWCPEIEPYLALPPGWRFLLAPGYEDVWFDESLLS